MKNSFRLLVFFALSLCLATAAFSQQPTAALTVVVTDPNSAVIPNATVKATNKATNQTRTVNTNDEGWFVRGNVKSRVAGQLEETDFEMLCQCWVFMNGRASTGSVCRLEISSVDAFRRAIARSSRLPSRFQRVAFDENKIQTSAEPGMPMVSQA